MKHILFENLIPDSYSNTILTEFNNLSWQFTDSASGVENNYDKTDKNIKNSVQFVHPIFDKDPLSSIYSLVYPILWFFEKETNFNIVDVLRIKANSLTRDGEDDKYQPPHIDMTSPGFHSLIYYINDSDGDTVLFNEQVPHSHTDLTENTRVSPKKGNALLLPSHLFHSSSCPIKYKRRLVINFIFKLDQCSI